MKWLSAILLGASALARIRALEGYTVPPDSVGFQHGNSTQAIQFDSHSLFVDGKRLFLWSGEFHYWRLPVPQLWSDILQKMKAAGFSVVSIYVHWGIVEGRPGHLDWNYHRSLEEFYKVAQRVGIYVVSRPGPYINAETTGGGLPAWLTKIPAIARTNDTAYIDAWQGYVKDFAQVTSKYQYPVGPVIAVQSENEFYASGANGFSNSSSEQMALLEYALHAHGIHTVPIIANDVSPAGNFATGLGEVDVYGFDAYPNGWNCTDPSLWRDFPNTYIPGHKSSAPWGPLWFPEFQGGGLDGWGSVGYDKCYQHTGPEFANVAYKNNVASGSTAMSFYMTYGGTNWGNLAYPGVYTSYDYGSPIRESRLLSPKYSEIKLQGLFYQSSPSLAASAIIGNTNTTETPYTDNKSIFTTHLSDGNGTNYYIVRQAYNNITAPSNFYLFANTTAGILKIPQYIDHISLAGRESKTLVTGYPFGKSTIQYSTAEVLTHLTLDGTNYIVLYVLPGQSFETAITAPILGTPEVTGSVLARTVNNTVVITGTPSSSSLSFVRFGDTGVIVADKWTATTFWQPRIVQSYSLTPDVPSVLVAGPYLVRNATVSGSTLKLVGDTNMTTTLAVLAPSSVKSLTWNGAPVSLSPNPLGVGLVGKLGGPNSVSLPNLKAASWKSADSLPEVSPTFDDSTWVIANKTSVARKQKPYNGSVVLYADEYGFHAGTFIYRGYFEGSSATGVQLSSQGGSGFGFSAFINGQFLGSNQGLPGIDTANSTFTFPLGALIDKTNVLTVIIDSHGLEGDWHSDDEFKNPRGIRGYSLIGGGDFTTWKLAGNLGGEYWPDQVRGPLNEGGLWAERSGAILPGYDYSKWSSSSPYAGIPKAGIAVYRTAFGLDIPAGTDASLALEFTRTPTSNYRSYIYVNGWQFGKFVSNYGPQTVFPIPEGILNHHGSNELIVTLWSLDKEGAKIEDLSLVSVGTLKSGKEVVIPGLVTSPTYQDLRK